MLAGDAAGARQALGAVLHDRLSAEWEVVAAQTALQLVSHRRSSESGDHDRPEEIVAAAEIAGYPFLARMARGLQAAVSVATSRQEWEIAACGDLVDDAERHGELWSVCLLNGLIGAAHVLAGHSGPAIAVLGRCAETASELGAPVIQVWAEGFRHLALANGRPSGREVAQLAAWADSFGVARRRPAAEQSGLVPTAPAADRYRE